MPSSDYKMPLLPAVQKTFVISLRTLGIRAWLKDTSYICTLLSSFNKNWNILHILMRREIALKATEGHLIIFNLQTIA